MFSQKWIQLDKNQLGWEPSGEMYQRDAMTSRDVASQLDGMLSMRNASHLILNKIFGRTTEKRNILASVSLRGRKHFSRFVLNLMRESLRCWNKRRRSQKTRIIHIPNGLFRISNPRSALNVTGNLFFIGIICHLNSNNWEEQGKTEKNIHLAVYNIFHSIITLWDDLLQEKL